MMSVGSWLSRFERLPWLNPSGGEPARPQQDNNSILVGERANAMPLLDQGATNGCGTTSLAMIMTFLGFERTQQEIDDAIRPQDIFSAPGDLVQYARDAGLNAEMYNHGTAEELAHFVDLGIPTQILTTADGSGDASKLHYVVITGYDVASDGSLSFEVQNPWGIVQTWTADELEKRWGNTPFGFDHFFLAFAPKDADLPRSRTDGVEGTLNAAEGIASVVGGYDRIVHASSPGELFRGLGDVGLGVPQALAGGVLGRLQLAADYAQAQVRDVPVAGSPLAAGLAHLEQRLGTVNSVVGAASNSLGHMQAALQHLAEGELRESAKALLRSQTDLVRGAWDATIDVVEDTVQGVADLAESAADVASDLASGAAAAVSSAVDSIGKWTGLW